MLDYSKKLFCYNSLFKEFVDLDTRNKLPNNILLTGQEGIGKTTFFAFHLVNYLFLKMKILVITLMKMKFAENKSYNLLTNFTHQISFCCKNERKKILKLIKLEICIIFK